MARSIYVMPLVTTTTPKGDRRDPKYRDDWIFAGLSASYDDYGNEPWCVVGITGVTPSVDAAITAHADVIKIPDNLDVTMGNTSVRTTWRNRLETVNMPGSWIQTTTTFREMMQFILAMCAIADRYQGVTADGTSRWFSGAVTLDNTFGSIGQNAQDNIISTMDSFPLDHSDLTGTVTLRQLLRNAGVRYIAGGFPTALEGPV